MACALENALLNEHQIKELIQNDASFAMEMYRALCNVIWVSPDGEEHGVSWRRAGEIISSIRSQGESYLDFYSGGGQGSISNQVEIEMKKAGWVWKDYPEEIDW